MKKVLFAIAIATTFVACKGKTDSKLDSSKDLILLTDSSRQGSYLTDTGMTATAASRNAGNTAPTRSNNNSSASSNNNSGSNNSTASSGSSSNTGTSTAPAPAPAKKGVSKAAKGAIIGGVGGAIIGGVATKSGKGAIIGGVVGAAGGYIIGRGKDKKDGRVKSN
jgi:hypothetical protein